MATITTTPAMTQVRITTSCPLSANKNPKFRITIKTQTQKAKANIDSKGRKEVKWE